MDSMNELLVISWSMPPVLGPRSLQVARTLKGLKNLGWNPTVVCVDPKSLSSRFKLDPELEAFYHGDYDVVPVETPSYRFSARAAIRFFPLLAKFPDRERWWAQNCASVADQLVSRKNFSAMIS